MKALVDRVLAAQALDHAKTSEPLRKLALVDENCSSDELQALSALDNLKILTNRYDIYQACRNQKLDADFSDFDFSTLKPGFSYCLYRISKERALAHYIFNQAARYLSNDGTIFIEGKKNEGIKGYYQNLKKNLGFVGELKKNKNVYSAALRRDTKATNIEPLDDKDYQNLRKLCIDGFHFSSKPGLYGWNKVDQGSRFLIASLAAVSALSPVAAAKSVLDLGCGYGYLSMKLLEQHSHGSFRDLQRLVATDNNAGAIAAAQANLKSSTTDATVHKVSCHVIPDDCGASLNEGFDLILCNPPFHQGFESSRTLTDKFLKNAANLLGKNGSAYFVVNSFIPLEKIAPQYFSRISLTASNPQFKVLHLQA